MSEEQISLDRYFKAVWRAKWFIIVVIIAAASVVAFLGLRQPTLYTATALIEVGRVWKEPLEDPYVTAATANGGGFIHSLAEKIGVRSAHLRRSLQADTVNAGPRRATYPILVRITASTESFDESMRLAQAVSDEIIVRHEKLFEESIAPRRQQQARLEERIKQSASSPASDLKLKLESELDQTRANNLSPVATEKTRLVDPVAQGAVISPSPWRNVAASGLIAAIFSIALAVLFDLFKTLKQSGND
jgi:hypothetical protein